MSIPDDNFDWRRIDLILLGKRPSHLWVLSLLLLISLAVWAYFDPGFGAAVNDPYGALVSLRHKGVQIEPDHDPLGGRWHRALLILGGGISLGLFFLLIMGAIFGPKSYRSLKSLLIFVTLGCLWLGLAMGLKNIAWYGKQMRVQPLLAKLQPIADELKSNWPSQDEVSQTLGPFKAYPLKNPNTLILMISPALPESEVRLTQVIRSEEGALRFLLAGSELGDWLEWHPKGSQPTAFADGFHADRDLSRHQDLGNGWYLVRYIW